MKIIKSTPNTNGAYPAVQSWSGAPPDGWLPVADGVDTSAMQTHAGFVALTVTDSTVTAVTGDDAKYKAWRDSLPAPTPQSDPIGDLEAVTAELVDQIVNLKIGG